MMSDIQGLGVVTPAQGQAVVGRLYLENLALRDIIASLTKENAELKAKLAEKKETPA